MVEKELLKFCAEEVSSFFRDEEWAAKTEDEKLDCCRQYSKYVEERFSGKKEYRIKRPSFMLSITPRRESVARAHKRAASEGRKKLYQEDKEEPLDHIIFCDQCETEVLDGCKIHQLKPIYDEKVPAGPNRAMKTAPKDWVKIAESMIPNAGLGVWSTTNIPEGIRFGPYEGKHSDCYHTSVYTWRIRTNTGSVFLDAIDECCSNWLRYVNCSRNDDEQNLFAYQYRGKIYYRTVKPIPPETELLVSYGRTYERELGIEKKKNHKRAPTLIKDCLNPRPRNYLRKKRKNNSNISDAEAQATNSLVYKPTDIEIDNVNEITPHHFTSELSEPIKAQPLQSKKKYDAEEPDLVSESNTEVPCALPVKRKLRDLMNNSTGPCFLCEDTVCPKLSNSEQKPHNSILYGKEVEIVSVPLCRNIHAQIVVTAIESKRDMITAMTS